MDKHLSLVTCTLLFCAAVCTAQTVLNPARTGVSKLTPQQLAHLADPATRSNMLAKTGGLLQHPSAGPSLLFLNLQARVSPDAVRDTSEEIRKIMRLPSTCESRPASDPVVQALKALANTNTAAVVVIADIAGYPSLLIAPESRWALVNIAALGGSDVPATLMAERTKKETWRAFGFLMGAANSAYEQCLMKSVLNPEELDALRPKTLCPEPFGKIVSHAQKLGMMPTRMSTYRKAVEEGWAPAPTNDVQKAIWTELKGKK